LLHEPITLVAVFRRTITTRRDIKTTFKLVEMKCFVLLLVEMTFNRKFRVHNSHGKTKPNRGSTYPSGSRSMMCVMQELKPCAQSVFWIQPTGMTSSVKMRLTVSLFIVSAIGLHVEN